MRSRATEQPNKLKVRSALLSPWPQRQVLLRVFEPLHFVTGRVKPSRAVFSVSSPAATGRWHYLCENRFYYVVLEHLLRVPVIARG